MYNAAHMAAKAIADAGKVETAAIRDALKGMEFDDAPQGPIKMRELDNQVITSSYLMQVREGWTGVNDMFEQIEGKLSVEPQDARCDNLPL